MIYLITCAYCAIQYVGRTRRRLRDRLRDHVYNTKNKHLTNVGKHFNECHGVDLTAICIQGIEKVVCPKGDGDKCRLLCTREVYWIFPLKTRFPHFINFDWDIYHIS